MSARKYTWHRIAYNADEILFAENNLALIQAGEKWVCIARFADRLFAFAPQCPHAGGSLATGYIDALGQIVCPLHRYRFDMQNGRNTSGEGYHLRTYPLEQRPEGVFIGLPAPGLFSW